MCIKMMYLQPNELLSAKQIKLPKWEGNFPFDLNHFNYCQSHLEMIFFLSFELLYDFIHGQCVNI